MNVTTEFILQVLGTLGGAIGAYVAIRADLAALKERVLIQQEAINRAHERIDDWRNRNG